MLLLCERRSFAFSSCSPQSFGWISSFWSKSDEATLAVPPNAQKDTNISMVASGLLQCCTRFVTVDDAEARACGITLPHNLALYVHHDPERRSQHQNRASSPLWARVSSPCYPCVHSGSEFPSSTSARLAWGELVEGGTYLSNHSLKSCGMVRPSYSSRQ